MTNKTAIILSYQRPIYLWATLDSLYRSTKSDVNFILVDQGSTDGGVFDVIAGFQARGMLGKVVRNEGNDPQILERLLQQHYHELGQTFFYIESDVVVYEEATCWTDRFQHFLDADPRLAMLGSQIDTADFVSREEAARFLGHEPSKAELKGIKWFSSERNAAPIGEREVASPFNPPGRLLALRRDAVAGCPRLRDGAMHEHLRAHGWTTGITGAVRHRHLSLLNLFDYPDYDMGRRDDFMKYQVQD